ncbi:unnamed protein product, partial [Rotaria sp. Silwood1]
LRIKLFDLMKSKGIVDNVKTHLRGRLIHELRGGVDNQIRFSSSTTQPTLLVRALNALILDYFQGQHYDYTTSVFVPEANINDYRIMSDEEILRLLNISTESSFYKKIKSNSEINDHTSLLMSMLTCISSWLPGSSQNNSTQTSNDLWAGSIAGSTLEIDYSSVRRMPTVKLSGQTQGTTTNTMPTSSSLQDISSHTQKFNWTKDQPSINLPESLLTSKNKTNDRQKSISQSNDRIFEHPEITIKPSTHDDKAHRRLLTTTTKPSHTNENSLGSAPNILEHPDIKKPIVMDINQKSSSSSSSPISNNDRKLTRQQSADIYTTRTQTILPFNRDTNQTNFVTNPIRSSSPVSSIDDLVERHEQEKSETTSSSTPPPTSKGPVKIIREYAETSSTSDVDSTGKHSNNHNNNHHKPQSEEDDFW